MSLDKCDTCVSLYDLRCERTHTSGKFPEKSILVGVLRLDLLSSKRRGALDSTLCKQRSVFDNKNVELGH